MIDPHPYRGIVEENGDGEYRNRLRVRVNGIHGPSVPVDSLPWADVIVPYIGQGQGENKTIPIGSSVVVQFLRGDPDFPIVLGAWLTTQDIRNTPTNEYVAGNATRVVEGSANEHFTGAFTQSTNSDHKIESAARSIRTARTINDTSTGGAVLRYGSLIQEVGGLASLVFEGPAEMFFLEGVSLSSMINFDVSSLQSIKLYVPNVNPLMPKSEIEITPLGIKLSSTSFEFTNGVASLLGILDQFLDIFSTHTTMTSLGPQLPDPVTLGLITALKVQLATMIPVVP